MRVVRPLLIPIALFSAARRRTRFRAVGCGRRRPAAGVGLDDAGGPSGDDAARARWDDVPRRAMRLCRGARRPRRLSYLGVSAGLGRASRQRCPLGRHSARRRHRDGCRHHRPPIPRPFVSAHSQNRRPRSHCHVARSPDRASDHSPSRRPLLRPLHVPVSSWPEACFRPYKLFPPRWFRRPRPRIPLARRRSACAECRTAPRFMPSPGARPPTEIRPARGPPPP